MTVPDFERVRDDFPRARTAAYFDNASSHPVSVHTAAALPPLRGLGHPQRGRSLVAGLGPAPRGGPPALRAPDPRRPGGDRLLPQHRGGREQPAQRHGRPPGRRQRGHQRPRLLRMPLQLQGEGGRRPGGAHRAQPRLAHRHGRHGRGHRRRHAPGLGGPGLQRQRLPGRRGRPERAGPRPRRLPLRRHHASRGRRAHRRGRHGHRPGCLFHLQVAHGGEGLRLPLRAPGPSAHGGQGVTAFGLGPPQLPTPGRMRRTGGPRSAS